MGNNDMSVAETLTQAHAALSEQLRLLDEAALAAGVVELRNRLGSTQTHLVEHFRLEEQNGYMGAVRERAPRLERAIEQLALEHHELARSLQALIAQSKAATSVDDPFRQQIREWIKRVRRHEAHENDVLQDAFNLDIGAED